MLRLACPSAKPNELSTADFSSRFLTSRRPVAMLVPEAKPTQLGIVTTPACHTKPTEVIQQSPHFGAGLKMNVRMRSTQHRGPGTITARMQIVHVQGQPFVDRAHF